MRLGFFDSGLGGLIILDAVRRLLPLYDYVYFGDTENVPYGDKTEEEIFSLTKAGIEKLFDEGALLVIVACNTASAESLRKLQDTMLVGTYADRRLLGVVIPTVESLKESNAKNVLLVGTTRTVDSKKYAHELFKSSKEIILFVEATPLLVSFIESDHIPEAETYLKKVIERYKREVDTVVLGCTHYIVLKDSLRKAYPELNFISQDEIIPKKLETYLLRHTEIETRLTKNKSIHLIESREDTPHTNFKKALVDRLRE